MSVRAIENMMHKERIGAIPHLFLTALSFLYGAGVRSRYLLYRAGVLRTRKLGCKVISVGNITVGGTGKTPVTILIASILKKNGHRPVILSRGYKKTGPGGIVSDGKSLKLGPREAGDEPYLMASLLPGVPVMAGADRFQSGQIALEKFRPDCVILDDGFQHIRIKRDLNILLIDGAIGLGNGHMLPRGPLREPAGAVRRADLIMIKGVKGGSLNGAGAELAREWNIPAMGFDYRATKLYDISDNTDKGVAFLEGRKILAVAGLANPASFLRTLEDLNANIINTITFQDHHDYTAADIEKIREAKGGADIIVTTEKDGVKLKECIKGGPPIFALGVEAVVEDEERLKGLLAPIFAKGGGRV
jgi:tetraacyldisaccharide 4'-kinase